jgi:hypothetical protein
LNNLFQEETIWKDLNETHKLGTALEYESVGGGDSVTNHTMTSSLSDFWEVMNQRYVDPEESGKRVGGGDRTTSLLRNKLLSATAQSRLINSAYNTPSSHPPPSSSAMKRMKVQTSEGTRFHHAAHSSLHNTHGHHQKMKLKPFHLKSPPRGSSAGPMPPPDAIVPDYLVHLDPLSLSVTTTLKGLGKLEGEHHKQKRKLSYHSDITGGDDDGTEMRTQRRDRTGSYDTQTTDDHTLHSTNTSWDEESATYTNQSNRYFIQTDKRFQNKQKISAEKLKDMTFMRNFFLQKATLADTHDLIRRMQVS